MALLYRLLGIKPVIVTVSYAAQGAVLTDVHARTGGNLMAKHQLLRAVGTGFVVLLTGRSRRRCDDQ